MRRTTTQVCLGALVCLMLAWPAAGAIVTIVPQETPAQDALTLPSVVHELGNLPWFPSDEWIDSSWSETAYRPCQENADDPGITNIAVAITNRSDRAWRNLHYVADPETSLANNDGLVNGCLAFKIDGIGQNTPLVSENMAQDGIFEVGETWVFVIQDYANSLGLNAARFGSIGAGSASEGDAHSSGSIIPEPATMSLLVLGGLVALRRRR